MSVVLYRPGDSHNVRGIRCEAITCNEHSFLHMLKDGWFYSPEETLKKEEGDIALVTVAVDTDQEEYLRKLAKEAGIVSYHNMGLEKLVGKLREANLIDEGSDACLTT